MRLNLSIILTIFFTTFCLVLYIIPNSTVHDFYADHFILLRLLSYFIKCFPVLIIIVSIFEIYKKKNVIQPIISLTLCVGFLLFIYWLLKPTKKLFREDVGRVVLETNNSIKDYRYYCKFDFNLQVGIELESEEIITEIKSNKNYILKIVKSAVEKNCYKDNLEEYINEICLDEINAKLINGEIEKIYFDNLTDSISTSGQMPK